MELKESEILLRVRRLAKLNYYQTIYAKAKEIHSIKIFRNELDFTPIQISFLTYLSFYNNLLTDYAMGEIEEIVFTDEIYEDAYSYYKTIEREKNMTDNINKLEKNVEKLNEVNWLLKSPKRK